MGKTYSKKHAQSDWVDDDSTVVPRKGSEERQNWRRVLNAEVEALYQALHTPIEKDI